MPASIYQFEKFHFSVEPLFEQPVILFSTRPESSIEFIDPNSETGIGRPYEHSGKAPLMGVVLALVFGLIVAPASGALYCFGITSVEAVFIEIVFALLHAAIVGLPIGVIGRMTKVRSETKIALITFSAVLAGYYVEWATHPYFALYEMGPDIRFFAWHPAEIWDWGVRLYAGGEFSGWFGVIVWVLEFVLINLMAIGFAALQVEQPFCENCDCWTERRDAVGHFRFPGIESEALKKLKSGDYTQLLVLSSISKRAPTRLEIDIDMCPACLQTCVLSCKMIDTKAGKDGKPEKKEHKLFERIVIDQDDLADIIAAGQMLEKNSLG